MNPIEMHMANTLLAHLPAREIEEHTLGDFLSFSPWSGGAFSHGNTGVELFNGSKVLCALFLKFPPISSPLPSVVKVSKQNRL